MRGSLLPQGLEPMNSPEDLQGVVGMLPDYFPFLICQLAGLFENHIRYAEFPQIVQERGATEEFDVSRLHAEPAADLHSGFGYSARMAVRQRRFRVDHLSKCLTDVVYGILVSGNSALFRFECHHFLE